MPTTKVAFPGSRSAQLAARLDTPDGAPSAYAIFAHCFTCSKDILAASRISEALVRQAIAVLRFDFTGLGASAAAWPVGVAQPHARTTLPRSSAGHPARRADQAR
jgi:alpha/beta superfamily hydrolase